MKQAINISHGSRGEKLVSTKGEGEALNLNHLFCRQEIGWSLYAFVAVATVAYDSYKRSSKIKIDDLYIADEINSQ